MSSANVKEIKIFDDGYSGWLLKITKTKNGWFGVATFRHRPWHKEIDYEYAYCGKNLALTYLELTRLCETDTRCNKLAWDKHWIRL